MPSQTLAAETRIELMEKKSRFIGIAFPCDSLATFQQCLKEVESEFPDARHIAYAYRIKDGGELKVRCHDADEPSGTAGKPIYNHLEGQDLLNCVIFVVRYFGGIKLGAGGLVRAYGNTAKLLLATAALRPLIETEDVTVRVDYPHLSTVEYQLALFQGTLADKSFGEDLTLVCRVPKEAMGAFTGALRDLRILKGETPGP